ncbi:MAG: 4-(cytidine 5'-diphospho)-2-C-methyl-D-erythritol kinase [Hyphomicrobium sp.]|nr:MAG: 4-(cytidine 5'-diphospho)-2-C-methyl-D-erythritol kinase [Hyphomicrobium sp.]
MTAILTERACAKINLTLRVLGRRTDGYHELESLVAFASDIYDVISLDSAAPTRVSVTGPTAAYLTGKNLVEEAQTLMQSLAPDEPIGALHLDKHLPIAAGIGGGSADAAAVLRIVQRAHPHVPEWQDLSSVAYKLGADVPVCFANRASIMSGIGEHLQNAVIPAACAIVLVNPQTHVPADKTARIFSALAAPEYSGYASPMSSLKFTDVDALLSYMAEHRNDLETVASKVVLEIADMCEALFATQGCRIARMSGAGPTCFGLFDTIELATDAALKLSANHPTWWIKASRLQ